MRKKRTLIALFAIMSVLVTFCACKDGETVAFPQMKEYSLTDGDGAHVADVPYDEYLQVAAFSDDLYWVSAKDKGASPEKSAFDNTSALQAAIDDASANGDGRGAVMVDGGVYYTGTLYMKSGVTLCIAEGSVLKLPDYDDYTTAEKRSLLKGALIRAEGVDGWSIVGPGKLDGNGTDYTKESENPTKNLPQATFNLKQKVLSYRERLRERRSEEFGCNLIYARNCRNVSLFNLVLYEPSTWTVKLELCDNVDISDVVIDNNIYVANSDGFDICGTSNVKITHCFIATGDDGIVLKSNVGEIENVTVSDCEIMSLANNFKIGTETGYDVKNVTVRDCYFFCAEIAGGYSGIAIESADGANVSDVTVSDITMNNVPSPILIWLGCRLDKGNGSDGTVGSISGISISNVFAKDADIASAIVGCEYKGVTYEAEDVALDNINVVYRECGEDLDVYNGNDVKHSNMNGYPEITRVSHLYLFSHETSEYYDMPVYGLYLYNARNVKATGFNVRPRSVNVRPFTNAGIYDARDGLTGCFVSSDSVTFSVQ